MTLDGPLARNIARQKEKRMATMTRQHFNLIAEVLAYQRRAARTLAKGKELEHREKELDLTTYMFANKLTETNERFDRDRFIQAAKG